MLKITPTPPIQKDSQKQRQEYKAPLKDIQLWFKEILKEKIKEINKLK